MLIDLIPHQCGCHRLALLYLTLEVDKHAVRTEEPDQLQLNKCKNAFQVLETILDHLYHL